MSKISSTSGHCSSGSIGHVVQEVFNAKVASIHYSQDLLSWLLTLQVNNYIGRTKSRANSGSKARLPPLYAEIFDLIETERSMHPMKKLDKSARTGILDIFTKGLDLDATDPRNKIFALLQFGEETQKLRSELRPGYPKTTVQVYADLSRWWIVTYKSLRILSGVQISSGRTRQTLSFSQASTPVEERASWSLWHDGHSNWAKGILGLSASVPYCAAADTSSDISSIRTCGSLVLPLVGRRVTAIEDVMSYPYYKPPTGHQDAYIAIFDPTNDHSK